MESVHEPVLLHEIVEFLAGSKRSVEKGQPFVFLDCTFGGGGHSAAMAQALKGELVAIGLDRDRQAVVRGRKLMSGLAEKSFIEEADFRNLGEILDRLGYAEINAVLFDLGLSSDELDPPAGQIGKGFSFRRDEPLLMTMGDPAKYPFTASDIVNGWEESVLADIIFGYGEERFARRIARAIVAYRAKKKIETSLELAEIVRMAVPRTSSGRGHAGAKGAVFKRRIDPATKTFQALRIAVNDELKALEKGLKSAYAKLAKGGRMAVISFHSLEDGIVKRFFKEREKIDGASVGKKPLGPSEEEILANPRSRSAKLRTLEK